MEHVPGAAQHMEQRQEATLASLCSVLAHNKSSTRDKGGVVGCLSHSTQHRSCGCAGVEQEQGKLAARSGKGSAELVLTSRRFLVLHSGDKERKSHHSFNPNRRTPQTQQTQDLGSSVPLPDPQKPPLTPTPALGRSRSIQDPFSSAAALPNSENE